MSKFLPTTDEQVLQFSAPENVTTSSIPIEQNHCVWVEQQQKTLTLGGQRKVVKLHDVSTVAHVLCLYNKWTEAAQNTQMCWLRF